ncbi:MAG: hypothetical protein Fur005_24510 [Roseiflexaceae bacterium]
MVNESTPTQQLLQRIDELEAQLYLVQQNNDLLVSGPFIVFRWVAAAGWPVDYVSENVRTLFGHTADDFTSGRVPFADVIHPEDLPRVGHEVSDYSAAGRKTFEQEYRIIHKNGDIRWIYDFTNVIRSETGNVTYYYGYVLDITKRKQDELDRIALQQQVIDAQQAALQELSTPLIPVSANAVVMPLIGAIDSRRAQQVIEALLHGINLHKAEIAIIDITGVLLVDTQVARAIVQAAQAARLLGTEVVLTGMRPEVAQTLVQLAVDLQGITALRSLESGIALALRSRNHG